MKSKFLAGPYIAWMAIFTVVPLAMVAYFAFTDSSGGFTFENFANASEYLPIFLRSIWYALAACLICLVVGYPVAYVIAKSTVNVQRVLYLLVTLPMCMSFLLRTLALVSLVRDTGIINNFLAVFGIGPLPLIRNAGSVIMGMVYNYLPFTILPLYTTMLKLDKSQIEAASDLGCNPFQVFLRSILPQSLPGIVSAAEMVFMPVMSSYVISDTLSEGKITLFGNSIYFNFSNSLWNEGSFMAFVMLILVALGMLVSGLTGHKSEERGTGRW